MTYDDDNVGKDEVVDNMWEEIQPRPQKRLDADPIVRGALASERQGLLYKNRLMAICGDYYTIEVVCTSYGRASYVVQVK
jgi:hypothetical protein